MSKTITVYEHQSIKLNQEFDGFKFDADMLCALQQYSGSKGVPYYSLIHNGVRFNEFVGVIQVGNIVIEVLPKADNNLTNLDDDKKQWRDLLIGMLRATGELDVHSTSKSALNLQPNSILDLYFELFIKEAEWLLHSGLIKQYRKKTSNLTTLKGNLIFSKNIQHNLVHAERFYVSHTTYDLQHLIHTIIYKTIRVLSRINTNNLLKGRISALLLNFPEMPDLNIDASTFERIVYTRKNQSYKNALSISRLLLLRLHPDIVHGKNDVLALMFDMNVLWEKFVYKSLRKYKHTDISVRDQVHKYFWKSETDQTKVKMIPDIVIENKSNGDHVVLDTKWKNLNGKNPSPEDLRQLYVYHKYFEATQVALIYPGAESFKSGIYLDQKTNEDQLNRCSVICIEIKENVSRIDLLQKHISDFIQEKITI